MSNDQGRVGPELTAGFFAFMRHELRTPISAMMGYVELLLEDLAERGNTETQEIEENLQGVSLCAQELLTLVNDLLDTSRTIEGTNLEDYIRELQHAVRTPLHTIIGYAELVLEEIEGKTELSYLADTAQIRTGAHDLFALLEHIVRLYQTRAGVREEGSLAKIIAAQMGSVMKPWEPVQRSTRGRILVIDDQASLRELLCRRLGRLGHTVLCCSDGEAALALLTKEVVDLVLLDVVMPGMSGLEVLSRLKSDPKLRETPVLVISALDEMDSVARCIALGAEDYLSKPFEPVVLRARVDACLEKKRLRDQEIAYLQSVTQVINAARDVEANAFSPESLSGIAERSDALGVLARVFVRMAREVKLRETRLEQQVQLLRIEIDEQRRKEEVEEITGSDFFKSLRERAKKLSSGNK
jgi:CheY-like chemotaxis protein